MESRKSEHLKLALSQAGEGITSDRRFYYEPMLGSHPSELLQKFSFLGKTMKAPLWISSMTGGTAEAAEINRRLAMVCNEFGLGMGLGSCRSLLSDKKYFADFDLRAIIGDQPFYANLGIAQVDELLTNGEAHRIKNLIGDLQADGLVVHVNPLQEWFQSEGNRFSRPPIETIARLLDEADYPVIVKEVGQGMGPESLHQLLKLPLAAVELAAFGGTNFSRIELSRKADLDAIEEPLVFAGHNAEEMVGFINRIVADDKNLMCRNVIISGGIRDYLDGYYLMETCKLPSVYGHGASFLKKAVEGYDQLRAFVENQIRGLRMAESFLKIRENG
jgi:isopentenyl-diphosphate delta-isomerase